jgi:ribosomal protein S27E
MESMGINLTCPQCGERMKFDRASTTVQCTNCGYKRGTGLDEKVEEIRANGPRPNVALRNPDEINGRAVSLFYTAHDHLFVGEKDAAIHCLESAIELQPDFTEAHLWVARTTDDEKLKRDHLSSILAYDGGNQEATQMMLVLNGRLTPEQAAAFAQNREPVLKTADAPVGTDTAVLHCPKCGGDLTFYEDTGRVECLFCGYTAHAPKKAVGNGDLLLAAMLERKVQPIRWVIGERLLHCDNCGAERTIAGNQLSTRCPFCNSNHVIEKDALDSFEQPEGLIPFSITREEAGAKIKERLSGMTERVKGWFDNNKIAQAALSGYYLPFWIFDATLQVSRTRVDNSPSLDRARLALPYMQTHFQDAVYDVEVCAVNSPPNALTSKLGDYHLREMVAYEPGLLARYPAQLYTVDFDRAALEARSRISSIMREKYDNRNLGDDRQVSIHVTTGIQQMSFRLVLLPVWIGTLVEQDKDVRSALVNGQTGEVVLGRSEKSQA